MASVYDCNEIAAMSRADFLSSAVTNLRRRAVPWPLSIINRGLLLRPSFTMGGPLKSEVLQYLNLDCFILNGSVEFYIQIC